MKKLIFLVILGALIYSAYLYFVKHQNPLTAFEKKGTATETVTTKTSETKNHLIFNLEIGKYVTVKSAIIPAGEIRLLGVDEANQSCMVSIYKSPGTVSKGMDLRKINGHSCRRERIYYQFKVRKTGFYKMQKSFLWLHRT